MRDVGLRYAFCLGGPQIQPEPLRTDPFRQRFFPAGLKAAHLRMKALERFSPSRRFLYWIEGTMKAYL